MIQFSRAQGFAAMLLGVGLLAVSPAQACQLVCMVTSNYYSGNLGGMAGANAKCALEFPGFKFARHRSILMNISTQPTSQGRVYNKSGQSAPAEALPNFNYPWIPSEVVAASIDTAAGSEFNGAWVGNAAGNNCSDWTYGTDNTQQGTIIGVNVASGMCLVPTRPLLCCNI